ncbi:hypothetical protein BX616_006572 [Lobosporangium transversale]|uniref:ICE2-domain-containing protein n=1 Tax=Lobosporangium transversale TaxID=64571 RepID=A0A1Y2GM74_9FUNG|nr:ICE2-domain-containing protein [Lobosporangium transversale]KAF9915248.1 hypothetical protein BX616_006572 [Lobosporangium transversale]ORZ13313.1 ICE2-domain-containing protein [Lobosporangium transversale]|eukprot:XP_021880394.1 ICE2-domain-containing protein [Lobosporangium transversale]
MLLSLLRTSWRGAHYLALLALLTLAFDVSKDCGLEYSLWLVSWYIAMVFFRRIVSRRSIRVAIKSGIMLEPLIVVGLLFLAMFRSTKGTSGSHWFWESIIKGSDPVLTILEGFGTILIIQKSSQLIRRLAARSDGYQIAFLVLSASVYVISGFGLYHLYAASSPELVPSVKSASVIGCCMTLTIVLSIIALVSGRGVITDTAFLFAYMVMSMYIAARNEVIENGPVKAVMPLHSAVQFGPFSIPYLRSLTLQDAERITIQAMVHLSQLMTVLVRALSPNVLISLLYRMGVLVAVSHIAPSLNIGQDGLSGSSSSANGHGYTRSSRRKSDVYGDDDDDDDLVSIGMMPFLASMAKPVLLMTHTRILLQYFGYLKPSLAIWGWLNSFLSLALFAAELVLARDDAWGHYRSD